MVTAGCMTSPDLDRKTLSAVARGAGRRGPVGSKQFEYAPPAHDAWMQKNARVRRHAVADVSRIPGFFGRIDRHVYHDGRADYIIARHESPVAAVLRVITIITHHKIFTRRYSHRSVIIGRIGRVRAVRLI